MTDTIDNPPAFPRTAYPGSIESNTPYAHHEQDGMTLRDYFAAAALSAVVRNHQGRRQDDLAETIARGAYTVADAMLAERARRKP